MLQLLLRRRQYTDSAFLSLMFHNFVALLLVLVVALVHLPCSYCSAAFSSAASSSSSSSNGNNNPTLSEMGTTKNVATQILQGVGSDIPHDRLNSYNIYNGTISSLEFVAKSWTANLVQKVNEREPLLRLNCQQQSNDAREQQIYVDPVTVTFPRLPQYKGSLGLELQEIQGGRKDGLGITITTDVIEGGSAAANSDANLLPGDSITNVAVLKRRNIGQSDEQQQQLKLNQEIVSVNTECLGYDATVQALSELPPVTGNNKDVEEFWQVTVKRLRRKPVVTVNVQFPPRRSDDEDSNQAEEGTVSYQLFAGENLRQGLLTRHGVLLNDKYVQRFDTKPAGSNCGAGGLCRTCTVRVIRDDAKLLNPPRIAEQTMMKDHSRWRLSCKTIVGWGLQEGEVTIRAYPRQW